MNLNMISMDSTPYESRTLRRCLKRYPASGPGLLIPTNWQPDLLVSFLRSEARHTLWFRSSLERTLDTNKFSVI